MVNLYTDTDLSSGPLLKFNEKLQYGTDAKLTSCIFNSTIFVAKVPKADIPIGPFDITKFAPMSSGLRQLPVDTETALRALTGVEYARVLNKAGMREYVFKPTAALTPEEDADPNNIPDNGGTGKWIYQILQAIHKRALLETVMPSSNMKGSDDYMSMSLGDVIKNIGGFTSETKDGHAAIVFPRDGEFEIIHTMVAIAPDTESGGGYKNHRFGLFLYRDGTRIQEIARVEVRMDDDGQSAWPLIHGTVNAKAGDYLRTLQIGSNNKQIIYDTRKITIKQMMESVVAVTPTGKYPVPGIEHDTGDVDADGAKIWRQGFRMTTYTDTVLLASGVKEYFGFEGRYKYNGGPVRSFNYPKSQHTIGEVYSDGGKLRFRKTDDVNPVDWIDVWVDYTKT